MAESALVRTVGVTDAIGEDGSIAGEVRGDDALGAHAASDTAASAATALQAARRDRLRTSYDTPRR